MSDNPFYVSNSSNGGTPLYIKVLQVLVFVTAVLLILYMFVFNPNQVDGPSMLPNFVNDQIVLTNKLSQYVGYTPVGKSLGLDYKRGDVIVFQTPGEGKAIIKRIIALPGESVAIRHNAVYVNGQKAIESDYLPPALQITGGDFIVDGGESKIVPENTFFVLGDNRPVSRDSRYESIGFVKNSWIKGKVIMVVWPLNEFSLVNSGKIEFIKE